MGHLGLKACMPLVGNYPVPDVFLHPLVEILQMVGVQNIHEGLCDPHWHVVANCACHRSNQRNEESGIQVVKIDELRTLVLGFDGDIDVQVSIYRYKVWALLLM